MGAIKFKYIVNKEFRLELLHFKYYSGHLCPIVTETEAHFQKSDSSTPSFVMICHELIESAT